METPGASSSEDFKMPVRICSPRKTTPGKYQEIQKCEVLLNRLPEKTERSFGSLLQVKKAKMDEEKRKAKLDEKQMDMASKLLMAMNALRDIQKETGLESKQLLDMGKPLFNEPEPKPVPSTSGTSTEAKKKRVAFRIPDQMRNKSWI